MRSEPVDSSLLGIDQRQGEEMQRKVEEMQRRMRGMNVRNESNTKQLQKANLSKISSSSLDRTDDDVYTLHQYSAASRMREKDVRDAYFPRTEGA